MREFSAEDASDLSSLQWHWGDVYKITVTNGVWFAIPITAPTEILTADDAFSLRMLVRDDYHKRQRTRP